MPSVDCILQAHAMVTSCPSDIGGWAEDGQSFVVLDTGRFSSEVIPRAFKHNKWSSFVRQLNNYGFRKMSTYVPDAHVYHHEHFVRDNPMLNLIRKAQSSRSKYHGYRISLLAFTYTAVGHRSQGSPNYDELAAEIAELHGEVNALIDIVLNLSRMIARFPSHKY